MALLSMSNVFGLFSIPLCKSQAQHLYVERVPGTVPTQGTQYPTAGA